MPRAALLTSPSFLPYSVSATQPVLSPLRYEYSIQPFLFTPGPDNFSFSLSFRFPFLFCFAFAPSPLRTTGASFSAPSCTPPKRTSSSRTRALSCWLVSAKQTYESPTSRGGSQRSARAGEERALACRPQCRAAPLEPRAPVVLFVRISLHPAGGDAGGNSWIGLQSLAAPHQKWGSRADAERRIILAKLSSRQPPAAAVAAPVQVSAPVVVSGGG